MPSGTTSARMPKHYRHDFYFDYGLGRFRLSAEFQKYWDETDLWIGSPEHLIKVASSTQSQLSWYAAASYWIHRRLEVGTYHSRFDATVALRPALVSHFHEQAVTARWDVNLHRDVKVEDTFMRGIPNSYSQRGFYQSLIRRDSCTIRIFWSFAAASCFDSGFLLRKKMRYLLALLTVSFHWFMGSPGSSRAGFVVIANPSVKASSISADDLKGVFLTTKTSLPDGSRGSPVLVEGGAAHEAFPKTCVGKSNAALQSYDRSLAFTGSGFIPKSFDTERPKPWRMWP